MDIFKYIYEEFPEAVFVADTESGTILYANKVAEKLLGLPKEKIIGLHQSQLHPQQDEVLYKKIFKEDSSKKKNNPLKRKTQKSLNLLVKHSSGRLIPVEIFSSTFEFQNKKYIIGLFLNSSNIKKLERKFHLINEIVLKSEEFFNQGSYQYQIHSQNPFVIISNGAKKLLGFKNNFIRFYDLYKLIVDEQKKDFKDFFFNTSIKNKNEFIFNISGRLNILSFQNFYLNNNIIFGIIKDITLEKDQLKQIESKNRHLQMLSECHKVLLFAIEEDVLLHQICKIIVLTGKYKLAWIGYKKYDKEKSIEIQAFYAEESNTEEYVKNLKLTWDANSPMGKGPAGIACRENQIDIEQDTLNSKRFEPVKNLIIKYGLNAVIGLPIIFNDRTIGTLVVYSYHPYAFEKDEVHILNELALNLGFGINLLRERKSKIKLLEQNILLTKILDNTNVGVIVVSRDGIILYVNKKFEEISGYLMNELLGNNINMFKSGLHDDTFYKQIWNTLLNKKDWKGEIVNKRKNGTLFLSRNFISPILNDKNEVSHFIQIIEDVTLEKYYQEQIEKSRFYDSLTELPNRNFFIEKLNQEIYNKKSFYLLYIDIDQFTKITHNLGLKLSDELLKEFSSSIQRFISTETSISDIFLARLGNDEFGILISNLSIEEVIIFIERLLTSIKRNYNLYEHDIYVSASIGVSIFPENSRTPDELIRLAEIALRRSKEEKGFGNFAFLTKEIESEIIERSQLETILNANVFFLQSKDRVKIENTGFYLEYQPIFNLKTNQIESIEALIRWKNPVLGLIPPSKFIPLAEKNMLIIPLGEFIIEEVIKQIVYWQDNHIKPVPVGINISYIQIQDKNFLNSLKNLLDLYKIDPHLIEFEITENAIIQDEVKAKKVLEELNHLNIKLLIDDFGTGYSSLSYLLKYKFDIIKIDQFFIKNLQDNNSHSSQALKLIRAIIQISKNLGLITVAEGIETLAQKEILIKEEVDLGQGFYLSKPLPKDEITKLLIKN